MKSFVVALVILVGAFLPGSARAGRFFFEQGCDTLSFAPPRFALKFALFDTYDYGTFCQARIETTSYGGWPAVPIVACTAPSALTCAIDSSAGSATYRSSPCMPDFWWFGDSLSLVVSTVPAYFMATLLGTAGEVRRVEFVQFPCGAISPARKTSWGRLLMRYR